MKAFWWAVTLAAVVGAVANASGCRWSFLVWTGTNIALTARHARRRDWPTAALFAAYLAISACGFIFWGQV